MPVKGKRQIGASSGGNASRAVKRRKQQNPKPQSESESGPKEVGTRYPPRSEVRIRKTIDLKEGSFVKKQKFVNGELVEESVEELDRDEAKAALEVKIVPSDLHSTRCPTAFHRSMTAPKSERNN
jgi:hypothetical protein